MIIENETEKELDQFFNQLRDKLASGKITTDEPEIAEPSPALLSLASEAATAYREYLFDHGFYQETLYFKAAATGDEQELPFQLDSIGGEWSITRENIPGDEHWQILKFRCRPELASLYEQRQVIATIGDQSYDLGEIFNCIAEAVIPRGIDLNQGINISVKEKI